MNKLLNWLKKQNEYIPLMGAILLFFASPPLLRAIDPTAGVYDVGVLQVNITAIISFCIFQVIVWMTLKVNWLPIRSYFEDTFTTDFKTLNAWQKIKISLSLYCVLLLSLVALSRVL